MSPRRQYGRIQALVGIVSLSHGHCYTLPFCALKARALQGCNVRQHGYRANSQKLNIN